MTEFLDFLVRPKASAYMDVSMTAPLDKFKNLKPRRTDFYQAWGL